jgi:lipopolysaccharide assembly outer membrane protein LptD (OstA)
LRFYSSSSFKRKIVVDSLNNREENKTLFLSEGVDFQVPVYIFNVQSRFNFSHTVYPEDTLGKKYPVYHRVSFGISSALTLYGTPVFKVPFLDKFLHIVTFSFGYRYSPYIKPLHLKESSFQRRSSSLDFSLKNDFVGKKQKSSFSLFTFTLSSSYDFLKEEKKLSDIDIKFSVPLPKGFTGGGSSVYSPYDKRIIKTSFYVDFNLKIPFSEVVFPSFKPVNISGTYSYNKFLSNEIYEERHFFNGSISGKITENWSFSYRASYDPQEKRISSQSVDLKRDLHCFSLSISWSKTGNFWDYRFRIWIKELPDLKIERTFFETLLPSLEE